MFIYCDKIGHMPIDVTSPEALKRIREVSIAAATESPSLFAMPIDRGQETIRREAGIPDEPVSIWDMDKQTREAHIIKYYLM